MSLHTKAAADNAVNRDVKIKTSEVSRDPGPSESRANTRTQADAI